MHLKSSIWALLFLGLLSSGYASGEESANDRLAGLYSEVLEQYSYVSSKDRLDARMVDYAALASDARWPRIIRLLAEVAPEDIASPAERKAFYLNAYNILAINKVIENWPLRSLRSVGSFISPVWKHDAGVVAGEEVTLSYLEQDVLRAMGDPRVHMAINCASLSCPDLRAEPYQADILEQQLEAQVRGFLQQDYKGILIDQDRKTVLLSSIFDWFEEDFDSYGGVERFLRRYRPDIPAGWSVEASLPYNWEINAELSAQTLRAMRDDF